MKVASLLVGVVCLSVFQLPAQQADKAERYREMLLKRPENAVLFGRLVDAWLAKGEMADLKLELEAKAAAGGSMDWRVLAVFRNFSGDEAGAIGALDEALKKAPDDPKTRLARAKALGAALRFEDAMVDLEVAAKDAATAMEAGTLRGKFLARAGQPAEAVKAWREVIAAHPGDDGLQEDLIELEIGEGMLEEAVEAARELAGKTQDPYQKALRRMRVSEILAQAGKKNEAVKEYREVFAVSAQGSWLEREVLARVNALFAREDDTVGLRGFYDSMRDTYPRRVVVKKEAALSLMASGESDEAVAMFREVLKVLPGDRDARDEFIAMLEGDGRNKEAAEEVLALLGSSPEDGALWEKLAGIRQAASDEAGVKEAVDKAVALVPVDEAGQISAAAIYERYGRLDDAEKTLRDAVEEHGLQGEAGEALAVMLALRGEPEKAVELWQEMAKTADREGLLRIARSLSANGHAADAFGILSSRMDDFEDDPLLLAAYCQAAQFSDKAEKAVPQALALVRMAKSSGDLETALRQAMAVISRAEDPRKYLMELEKAEEPTIQELCLLAEMHESLGDSIAADGVLKKALDGDAPLLAAAQRVRLLEMRGDLTGAIAATREWMALPGGMRTAQVKRVVALYERLGDTGEALKESENWKRMAPGDKLAWMKRAEIFLAEGNPEEAVAELRRALAKFGSDDEMRAKLATAMAEAGMYAESWRMFYGLYDEADTPASKLKWAGLLAGLAAQEGREEDLVRDFKRRAKDNPSSVVQQLAMAEMYREWMLPDQEIEVVEEASRRKPDDAGLLQRLAFLEEQNGSNEKAEALLKRALRMEESPESRRLLSAFWIRTGEVEKGLAELRSAKGGADPRQTEKLAMSLAGRNEWETAAKVLADEVRQHPDDWRLGYLHGVALRESGAKDEAFTRFASLLNADVDLPAVLPLINAQQMKWLDKGAPEAANFRKYARFKNMTDRSPNRRMHYGGMNQGAVLLPGLPSEVRWMAFCEALALVEASPDLLAGRIPELKSPKLGELETIKIVHGLKPDELRERLMADGADIRLFAWYLSTQDYRLNPYGNRKIDFEVLHKGVQRCIDEDPMLAIQLMSRLPIGGKEGLGTDDARRLFEMVSGLDDEKRRENIGSLRMLAFDGEDVVPLEIKQEAEALYVADLKATEEESGPSYLSYTLATQWLTDGRIDDAAALMNDQYEAGKEPARKKSGNPMQRMYGGGMRGPNQKLKFPEILATTVNHVYPSLFNPASRGGARKPSPAQTKLIKILREKAGDSGNQPGAQEKVDPELLGKLLPKLTDPFLRVLVASGSGDEKLLEQEMERFEKGNESDARALLVLAAYQMSVKEDSAKAYEFLVAARAFAKDSMVRNTVDWSIYQAGLELVGKAPEGLDLEPARRAALRLRRRMAADENSKRQLADGMNKLGLEEESQRYTKARRAIMARRSSYSGMNARSSIGGSDQKALISLVSQGKSDIAARKLLLDLRRLQSGNSSNKEYEIRQRIELMTSMKLEDKVMVIAEKRVGDSYRSRREYAMLLVQLKKLEPALPLLRTLVEEKSEDFEVRSALLLALPKDEQIEYVKTLSGGEFDSDQIGSWFNSQLRRRESMEEFLASVELFVGFIELLEPSFDADRNLSWVPYCSKGLFDRDRIGDVKLRSFRNNRSSSESVDEEKTKERDALALRLYQAMLQHPQTCEQGFMLMNAARRILEIPAEDLDKAALSALATGLRLKEDPEVNRRFGGNRAYRLWYWMKSSGGGTSRGSPNAGVGPMPYLMREASDGKGVNPYTPELLASLDETDLELAASLRESIQIVETPGIEAFNTWMEGVRDSPAEAADSLLVIIRLASFGKRADLMDAALEFCCELTLGAENRSYGVRVADTSEGLAQIVSSAVGYDGKTAVIVEITERLLGPPETWELYAQIGRNTGAYVIDRRLSAYQKLTQAVKGYPDSLVALARFTARHRFGTVNGVQINSFLWSDRMGMDAAEISKFWIDSGLLSPGPELAGSCTNNGSSIVEALEKSAANRGGEKKGELAGVMVSIKGPERFWARMLGARLKDDSALAIAELNRNAEVFSKWPPNAKYDLARLVQSWFPNAEEKAAKPVRRLLVESRTKGDQDARKQAEGYLRDGFSQDMRPYSADEKLGGMMANLIEDDAGMAAEVWIKAIEHFDAIQSGGSSSSNGFRRSPSQYASSRLLDKLGQRKVAIPNLIEFFHLLEKGKPGALSGMFSSNSGYYIRRIVDTYRTGAKTAIEKEKSLEGLDGNPRQLAGSLLLLGRESEADVRPGLAAFFLTSEIYNSSHLGGSSREAFLKWLREDLRKLDADLAHAAMLMTLPRKNEKVEDSEKPEFRDAFRAIVANPKIPVDLRVCVTAMLAGKRSMDFRVGDAACSSALADLLVFIAGSGDWASTDSFACLKEFARPGEISEEDATRVLAAIRANPPELMTSSNNSAAADLNRAMLSLAIHCRDEAEIKKLVRSGVAADRGDLDTMVQLWQGGFAESAVALLARPGEYHSGARNRLFKQSDMTGVLASYSRNLEEKLPEWLATIPNPGHRFRVECLISSIPDAEGDDAPQRKRPERIRELVGRFADEAPKARSSRNEALAALAVESGEIAGLLGEYEKAIGKQTLGLLLPLRQQSSSDSAEVNSTYVTEALIRAAMRLTVEEGGDATVLLNQLKSIALVMVGNQRYEARNLMNKLGPWYACLLVRTIIDLPAGERAAPAATALEISAVLLEHGESGAKRSAVGLAIASQAAAGDGAALDRWLAALPEPLRKAYDDTRGERGLKGVIGELKKDPLTKPEYEKSRLALLTAIVSDPATIARDILVQSDINALTDNGTFSREEFISVVDSIPEDNPIRVELLVEKGGINGWALDKTDEAIAAYEEAIAAAGDSSYGLNYAKAYHAFFLGSKLHRDQEALEIVKTVDTTDLKEFERGMVTDFLMDDLLIDSRKLLLGMPALDESGRAKAAEEALANSKRLLECERSGFYGAAVGIAIVSQAVAGDGAALDGWLESLPEPLRDLYQKTRGDIGLKGSIAALKGGPIGLPENKKNRRALLKAIVSDPATALREVRLQSDANALASAETFSQEDFFAVVEAVRKTSPVKVALLVEKAGVNGWALGKVDEALAAYRQAQAAAGDDAVLLNYTKAHHAQYLDNCLHRTEDALKIAKNIDIEVLEQEERNFVSDIMKKNVSKPENK